MFGCLMRTGAYCPAVVAVVLCICWLVCSDTGGGGFKRYFDEIASVLKRHFPDVRIDREIVEVRAIPAVGTVAAENATQVFFGDC